MPFPSGKYWSVVGPVTFWPTQSRTRGSRYTTQRQTVTEFHTHRGRKKKIRKQSRRCCRSSCDACFVFKKILFIVCLVSRFPTWFQVISISPLMTSNEHQLASKTKKERKIVVVIRGRFLFDRPVAAVKQRHTHGRLYFQRTHLKSRKLLPGLETAFQMQLIYLSFCFLILILRSTELTRNWWWYNRKLAWGRNRKGGLNSMLNKMKADRTLRTAYNCNRHWSA